MAENNLFLKSALEYAQMGLAVIPNYPRTKKPIPLDWTNAATTDIDTIKGWWKDHPNANIGVVCGSKSGDLLIVDIDTKEDGVDGFDSLSAWEKEHGELPETVRSITGRGGSHLLYRINRPLSNRTGVLPGIDIRANGGQIIVPPSVHPNGNSYEWEYDPSEYQIAEANESVYELAVYGKTKALADQEQSEQFSLPERITAGKRNETLFKSACSLQVRGFSDEAMLEAIRIENKKRCSPPLDDEEIGKIVESAKKYVKGQLAAKDKYNGLDLIYVTDKRGNTTARQCSENMFRVIQQDSALADKVRYDEFNYRPMYFGQLPWRKEGDTFGDWTDGDDAALRSYLDIRYGLTRRSHYDDAIQMVLMDNRYNPLTGYLDALQWDGVHRMGTILPDYLGCDRNEYTEGVTKVFTLGMVRRAFLPGSKFDYALNLVGPQGKGKSTAFKYLACRDEWYDDSFSFRNADAKATIERMEGKWVLEMGEMALLKKDSVSADTLKAFLTSQADKYRVPFDKRSANRKRSCVFCGTSNDINFLKDRTGNRRFLPVDIHPELAIKNIFDEDAAREEFRQVIAEAVHYFKEHPNEPPVLPKELEQIAERMQADHLEEDAWVSLIQDFLDKTPMSRVNALCLWENAFHKEGADMKRAEGTRILTIMRNDIEGWHEIGKARCDGYGRSLICFEKNIIIPGFEDVPDDEAVPF